MSVSYQVVQLETQNVSSQINQLLDFVPIIMITMTFISKLKSHVYIFSNVPHRSRNNVIEIILNQPHFYLNKKNHSQLTKISTKLFSCPLRLIGPPE